MNAQAFRQLYDYHFNENRATWDKYIAPLPPESFTQHINYSIGSVRNHIVHLFEVDDAWFSELQGIEPLASLSADTNDLNAIRAYGDAVEQRMRAYLANLQDETLLTTPITEPEEDRHLTVWQVLIHVVNHGTDHRAQFLRILHDFGVDTRSQDFVFHLYP